MSMKFDFRTKLLVIVLAMSLVAVLTSDILIYTLLGVLSVYLIIQGFGRQTIKYLIVCGIFIVLRLLSGGQGITILMPEMFLFMVLRILMMVMAAQPVIGMPPGEVVAVFKKIHAPNGIALPVTFMLRFFPTVRSEFLPSTAKAVVMETPSGRNGVYCYACYFPFIQNSRRTCRFC